MTLLERANKVSPKACRLNARKSRGRLPMSCQDIADKSGLSKSMVANLSNRDRWDGIPIDTVTRFAMACGVNHLKLERTLDFMRRKPMSHLKRGTRAQRRCFGKLLTV